MTDVQSTLILVCCRAAQIVFVIFIVLYAWDCRTDVKAFLKCARSTIFRPSLDNVSEKQRKFRLRAADEFLRWRFGIHCRLVKYILPVFSVYMIFNVVMLQEASLQVLLSSTVGWGVLYILCVLVDRGSIAASSRFFDFMLAAYLTLYLSRVIREFLTLGFFSKLVVRRYAPTLRALASCVYLNYRRVAVANALVSTIDIAVHAAEEEPRTDWRMEAMSELFALAYTLILAFIVEEAGRSLVTQRLESKASAGGWRAVRSILSVLCDAVVHLGSDLTILDDSPHLGHLLLSGMGATRKLEGGSFLRHVVDEDKQMFERFLSRQSEFARPSVDSSSCDRTDDLAAVCPAALHVSLKDAMGSVLRVEVIHAHLSNDDEDGHLLGVRELGDHEREVSLGRLPSEFRSEGPSLPTHQSCPSSSGSSDSDSLSQGESQSGTESGKIRSLSMLVDMFDRELPILEATIGFQSLDDSPRSDQNLMPTLSTWLSPGEFSPFHEWAQTVANCLANSQSVPSYGQVTLRPSGSLLTISARRAYAEAEQDAVRVRFKGVNLRCSDVLKRRTSLPCIRETSTPARSSAGTCTMVAGPGLQNRSQLDVQSHLSL
eukprot:TRINITY_DN10687_c0_g4_i1.p1 TRINITY_DN10687_c0_g4~~TRINITY_DN10687_c0_g4_i1.p1  ORF type:complete len:601 (+),score=46.20 TRINITY_DN10687_c0_g4_i1:50-1852(+)